MADDKTAAELRDRIANRLELGLANSANYTPDEVLLRQAWQALGHAEQAVRRVAPDRETLGKAEAELLEWATGKRSWINEMLSVEASPDHRVETLALVEARDADAIRAAREKVEALRLLASGVLGVPADEAGTTCESSRPSDG